MISAGELCVTVAMWNVVVFPGLRKKTLTTYEQLMSKSKHGDSTSLSTALLASGGAGGGMQLFFPANVTGRPWEVPMNTTALGGIFSLCLPGCGQVDHWISWGSGGGHGCDLFDLLRDGGGKCHLQNLNCILCVMSVTCQHLLLCRDGILSFESKLS